MNKKLKIIIPLFVVLMGAVVLISRFGNFTASNKTQEEENYTPVEVHEVSVGTIENKIKINGKIAANEEIAVIPKAMGIVTKVNVKLGDFVKEGDTLFTIEQDDIAKSVEQAANAVQMAGNGVTQAENGLQTAKLNYELNKEKIENAQLNLERIEKLYEEGAVSKSQLEQAQLAADGKNLEMLMGQVNQAETAHKQALNQLRQAEIAHEQALSGLGNTVVKSPMDGFISTLSVKEGQIATNSQPATTIVETDKVYIQINVVENIVNRLHVGQEVEVNVPAAFDDYVTSTISYISPTTDIRTQLYTVKIYIDNSEQKIRPGMNGEVKLSMDTVDSAIVIKGDAVLDKEDKKMVFIVEDNTAIEREVITGLDTGDYIEIKEGLEEGEHIIVEGQHYVENGGKVKVVRGD
ncbi:MAG TPA: efflux RND transporter periplasmic adaptor subunit [Clostridia bacterium]|nr:efflux RND transporter periplasmic adaptor subunit [Clostridia bacterium]